MKKTDYICDVCSKSRDKDSNHWFLITVGERSLIIAPWSKATPEEIDESDYHICGWLDMTKKVNQIVESRFS